MFHTNVKKIVTMVIMSMAYRVYLTQLPKQSQARRVWLSRPGTVYICEGDTAHFVWNFNHSIGGVLQSVQFFKSHPSWQSLIEQTGNQQHERHMDRADLIENTTFGFTLAKALLSDSGRYEIDVYYDDPQWLNHDRAYLQVIKQSACPDRLKYAHPPMYMTQTLGKPSTEPIYSGKLLELQTYGEIRLLVKIPAADPPVKCSISKTQRLYNCSGAIDVESQCEANLYFHKFGDHEVSVNMTYIALETKTTIFHVRVKDGDAQTETFDSATPSQATAPSASDVTALIGLISIPVAVLSLLLCLFLLTVLHILLKKQSDTATDGSQKSLLEKFLVPSGMMDGKDSKQCPDNQP